MVAGLLVLFVGAGWALVLERIKYERRTSVSAIVHQNEILAQAEFTARARTYYLVGAAATLMLGLFAAAMILMLTRQARTIEERRRADARYRETFDLAPIGIAHQAMDGRYIRVNRALCRMLGYTEEELLGRTFLEVLHPDDGAKVLRQMRALRSAGTTLPPAGVKVENRHIRKDGSELLAAVSVTFVEGESRAPEYCVAMVEDITEARRAERALAESRARYQDLVDNTADFIWELDSELRFTYASGSLRSLLGVDPGTVLGRTPLEFMPDADGRRMQDEVARIRATGGSFAGLEHLVIDSAGKKHVWEASGAPILGSDGAVRGYRGVSRDVTARRDEQLARQRSERRFRSYFELGLAGMAITHPARGFLEVNERFCEILGYTREEVLRLGDWAGITHPEDVATDLQQYNRALAGAIDGYSMEKRFLRKDGRTVSTTIDVKCVRKDDGQVDYFIGMMEDITERKRAQDRLEATFNQAAVGIATATPDMTLIEANARFGEMLGYAPHELAGRSFQDFTHPEDVARSIGLRDVMLSDPAAPFSGELEKRYIHKDGRVVWAVVAGALVRDAARKPDYFVVVARDITEQKQTQERLEHRSYYDALTDLPNRRLLADRLAQGLTQAARKRWTTGLLLLDLDRFKAVNDALGQAGGDELLREAARRLKASVRAGDTVARVGGDEFAVMLTEIAKPADAARVGDKIRRALNVPFQVQGQELFVSASIGIATEPPDGGTEEVLFKNAEAAKFRAKELGRNTMQFYAAAMNERVLERVMVENGLRRALEKNEFVLHYQPKARIAGRPVAGFEALLRWNRDGQGLVPPGQFIPVLEDSGLILPVGEWVIGEACRQLRAWEELGLHPLPIAVNVSARQFAAENALSELVARAVAQFRVDPRLLEIEITESDVMRDAERAIAEMARLRELGVRLSIDDFGTGYSSLGYLKRFPVHKLKLDRSFVTGLPHDADDVSIARAVVSMAHSLRLQVVAEGVETEEQRAFLAQIGCDQLQGYLLARPLPAAECLPFLSARAAA